MLKSKIDNLRRLYPDAKIGYRGSLAIGTKYNNGNPLPFDPKDWDVDAFSVSDELSKKIHKKKGSEMEEIFKK